MVNRVINEPKIESLVLFDKWYISRVVNYLSNGEATYQYMWKDRSWHRTCGSANMWESKEDADRFLYGDDVTYFSESDFEI